MTMTVLLSSWRLLTFALLFTAIVLAEETCKLDGTCIDKCEDVSGDCKSWAQEGLCRDNQDYMFKICPKACHACGDGYQDQYDYGVAQTIAEPHVAEIAQAMDDMKAYFRTKREDPKTSKSLHKVLDNCKNRHESCAFWKVIGECEKNPSYMKKSCAPICQTCEHLSIEFRCPLDPDAPVAWKPGDLNIFFLNITTLPEFSKYEPQILSRPDFINGDTEETADYKIGPWVVTLDKFVTDEEADRLIELGAEEGYKRSSDVGKVKFDGSFEENVNNGRTSLNAWCQHACYNDTAAKQVISRIEEITHIPENNSEYLQLLKYDVGQYYQRHHDFIDFGNDRQSGVRILTVFLYLNDVEAGGGTNFPLLDITVMPKRGRVLIWPSVLDSEPNRKDRRTDHQALPVEKGTKYGANAWLHQRDFKTPNRIGCH